MTTVNNHLVSSCRWQTQFDDEKQAVKLQNYLSEFSRQQLPQLLEQVFAQWLPEGARLRLDSLNLDLGVIEFSRIQQELPEKLLAALRQQFKQEWGCPGSLRAQCTQPPAQFQSDWPANDDQQSPNLASAVDSQLDVLELLKQFLLTGTTPWWYEGSLNPETGAPVGGTGQGSAQVGQGQTHGLAGNAGTQSSAALLDLYIANIEPSANQGRVLLAILADNANARKRLIWQWRRRGLVATLKRLAPGWQPLACDFTDFLALVIQGSPLLPNTGYFTGLQRHCDLWLLTALLEAKAAATGLPEIVGAVMQQAAAYLGIAVADLQSAITDALQTGRVKLNQPELRAVLGAPPGSRQAHYASQALGQPVAVTANDPQYSIPTKRLQAILRWLQAGAKPVRFASPGLALPEFMALLQGHRGELRDLLGLSTADNPPQGNTARATPEASSDPTIHQRFNSLIAACEPTSLALALCAKSNSNQAQSALVFLLHACPDGFSFSQWQSLLAQQVVHCWLTATDGSLRIELLLGELQGQLQQVNPGFDLGRWLQHSRRQLPEVLRQYLALLPSHSASGESATSGAWEKSEAVEKSQTVTMDNTMGIADDRTDQDVTIHPTQHATIHPTQDIRIQPTQDAGIHPFQGRLNPLEPRWMQLSNAGRAAANSNAGHSGQGLPAQSRNKLNEGQSYVINNAGLVLLNSFFLPYLQRLQLVSESQFVSSQAQLDAVHYLQFLASGHCQTEEHHLFLNKVLCGIEQEQPLEAGIAMAPEQKQLADSLLDSVIQHWPSCGSSSSDGFRGNWLIRQGVLLKQGENWHLTVEKRPYDVLLAKAPVSWSIIKLPWQDKPLYVDWPY